MKPQRVEIHVRGGIATVAYKDAGIVVTIRDFDVTWGNGPTDHLTVYGEHEQIARRRRCDDTGTRPSRS